MDEVPQLWEGHVYFVAFRNEDETPGQLGYWHTAKISQFKLGDRVKFPPFDIGEVQLVAPAPLARVNFPEEFRWKKRAATPSDRYRLTFVGSETGVTALYDYNQESVTCYCVTTPQVYFAAEATARWSIHIESPEGGRGETLQRKVIFSPNVP